jgi:hypothetical protein
MMPEKLEFEPDFCRKRAAEARRLSELIEDNFTAETLLEIARGTMSLPCAPSDDRIGAIELSRPAPWGVKQRSA